MSERRACRSQTPPAAFAIVVIAAMAFAASPASAQRGGGGFGGRGRFMREMSKNGDSTKSAFTGVIADAAASTVRIKCNGRDAALGTVVGSDGLILTKASELYGTITCACKGNSEPAPATIVGVLDTHDLALLKIDITGLQPVTWGDPSHVEVGQWVATPGMADAPVAIGVLSVGRRRIPNRRGLLGILLAEGEGNPKIKEVYSNSPAQRAGLMADDIITRVNDKAVASVVQLQAAVGEFLGGQEVKVIVSRGDKSLEITAKLATSVAESSRSDTMNQMGGELSLRSAGFPVALQHDTVLAPTQCGGPLVTLDGKAIGINIARAGRVETFAVPADVIQSVLGDLKSGKLAPPPPPTTSPSTKPSLASTPFNEEDVAERMRARRQEQLGH